ncbi:MAG: class I tRNA ligase family protein [Candidatus Pacebacteria bacterium]|nr:class I tRNA ligase family protein [Candidatus Paceibacterota bacterium]MBP9772329.1 class I tRNA ligase family protein [Candidatus Paceibacterota bacterium]
MSEENQKPNKSESALREEAVLKLWQEKDIFSKTLSKDSPQGEFVFFDGPPTANGMPGLHHLEPRCFKDAIPRYKTMRGYHVRRKGGWDTHGLPVELQVEKELGLKSKKEIEEYGVEKFNQKCRESVWKYIDEWEKFTDRVAYWVDHKNPYVTYHNSYIESVWNILAETEKKKLLYKDYKVLPWCPRCGTALSSHELAQGYQDDKDLSVTAKFKVVGEENTYFLAWTTTPWTLPGNVGLAVGEDIDYVKIKKENNILILAKERLSVVEGEYEFVEEIKGKDLVGLEYEPLYSYFKNLAPKNVDMKNAYKVHGADFVTTTDGTGIVHTAVMYGQDDFALGTKVGMPKFHLVKEDGHFLEGMDFLSGRFVKDEEVAIDIIKDLAHRGLLFKKEKYEHSYPHCWRCKTPLIYYARDSWYIGMSKLRNQLLKENDSIKWEPSHIKDGRFGEWLREVKDWAISRERYWGTPLPIWQSEDGERIVVDSIDTLKKYTKKSGNKYFVMRHGEAESNTANKWNCDKNIPIHLTEKGRGQVEQSAEKLKNKKITKIFASPFLRTKETASIVAKSVGFSESDIIYDDRLGEFKFGDFVNKERQVYFDWRDNEGNNFFIKTPNGESLEDAKKRFGEFIYEIENKYTDETILIVSHGIGYQMLFPIMTGISAQETLDFWKSKRSSNGEILLTTGEVQEFPFVPLPHNKNFELDLHKPFIDSVELEKDGKKFKRVKEVMDVWFDSGAMPFAQDNYPFGNDKNVFQPKKGFFKKTRGYPADFICEAIDQTRGWFYTLHAIGALMGTGKAYKNVICLGHILDAEGKKMSKSLGNIVEPWEMFDKYGADTLRLWMYSVNQPGDSKNFDEKTVLDLHRKFFGLLYNVLAFYELYRERDAEIDVEKEARSTTVVLDQWILARLDQLVELSTNNLENYKLLEPVRATRDFIDDFSTWYLRRSRDRLKDGSLSAKMTMYVVLKTLSKIIAPFAPFSAEDMWQKLKVEGDEESVHLTAWPKAGKVDKKIIEEMQKVRDLCTEGNSIRKKQNIPLRQPLAAFFVKEKLSSEFAEIIKDELNVKNVEVGSEVSFDTNITPELKREGDYRELLRSIQDMRKEKGLKPSDVIKLALANEYKETVSGFEEDLKKTAGVLDIAFGDSEEKIRIN